MARVTWKKFKNHFSMRGRAAEGGPGTYVRWGVHPQHTGRVHSTSVPCGTTHLARSRGNGASGSRAALAREGERVHDLEPPLAWLGASLRGDVPLNLLEHSGSPCCHAARLRSEWCILPEVASPVDETRGVHRSRD